MMHECSANTFLSFVWVKSFISSATVLLSLATRCLAVHLPSVWLTIKLDRDQNDFTQKMVKHLMGKK